MLVISIEDMNEVNLFNSKWDLAVTLCWSAVIESVACHMGNIVKLFLN